MKGKKLATQEKTGNEVQGAREERVREKKAWSEEVKLLRSKSIRGS